MSGVGGGGNVTCASYYAGLNVTGFALFYSIQKCLDLQSGDMGSSGGRGGVDTFITTVANEYFKEAKQIMILYDESWEITDPIFKLGKTTEKAFITYFLPLDKLLGERITSKPSDHFSHRTLPKATAFIIFAKDESGFSNILRLTTMYPWWNQRARIVILLKDKASDPTKGILNLLLARKIYNGVVVTEVVVKASDGSAASATGEGVEFGEGDEGQARENTNTVALQVAALDPYPPPGQPKQIYIARWSGGQFTTQLQPIFQDKMENLRSATLIACVFEFPPLVIREEVGTGKNRRYEYSGLEVQIFKELSHLMNFTFEFYEPPEGERWGIDTGNNTWSGLIGETQRTADIGFASVFLLDNREKAVEVSTPYDQDQGCFAVPRPEALQHWLGLVLPFSWQVWVCILSMAFVAGPIFAGITKPMKQDESLTVGRGIFYALGSMVSTQKAPKAKSSALRSFIISWLIFCWLAAILYRVALIVSLTVGPANWRIDTLRALVRAGLTWGGFEEVIKTFTNTSDISEQSLFDRFEPLTNITKALDRVATVGDYAVLDSGKYLRYAANGRYFDGYSSAIHIAKECPTSYNVGFIMPIGSPLIDRFNQVIRRMQNCGLIDKWLRDILYLATIRNPNKDRTTKRKFGLTVDHLKLCFVLVLCGGFIGFCILCGEWCLDSFRKKNIALAVLALRKNSHFSIRSERMRASSPSVVITDADDLDEASPPPQYLAAVSEQNLRKHSINSILHSDLDTPRLKEE